MKRRLLGCCLFVALLGAAPDSQQVFQIIDGKKVFKPWDEVVGRVVTVEGLAWGVHEKGLGERVILDGTTVYVSGFNFNNHDAKGRPVRVQGTLRKKLMRAAPRSAQGYGSDFEYFEIDVEKWSIIDRVKTPWMQEVPQK